MMTRADGLPDENPKFSSGCPAVMKILRWICFILRCVLYLVLLPFVLIYAVIRWLNARAAFIRGAVKTGVDRRDARLLAKTISPGVMLSSDKKAG